MLLHCPLVAGDFPVAKLRLANRGPARLVWDEHGGTFVLRLDGLEVLEAPELEGEDRLRLEAALPEPGELAREIEGFAGFHGLRLEPAGAPELTEKPRLAACHIPEKNLFIFCEEPRLTARRGAGQVLEILVTGAFKARRVPCQETDAVIHLDKAAMGRLLAGLLAWSREG